MSWWNSTDIDNNIWHEVSHYTHKVVELVDHVVGDIEHWLGKDNNHVVITYDIPVIPSTKQPKPQHTESKTMPPPPARPQYKYTDHISHKSYHCPQILKTADPFVEGGLINTELLIEDLMHNLPPHVPRNEHTKRALLAIIVKHLQQHHTSPDTGKHNWVSFTQQLNDKDLHNRQLEEEIAASIQKFYASEEQVLHRNHPVLTPTESALKDKKYWEEQVISHVLHGMEEVDRIQIGSI